MRKLLLFILTVSLLVGLGYAQELREKSSPKKLEKHQSAEVGTPRVRTMDVEQTKQARAERKAAQKMQEMQDLRVNPDAAAAKPAEQDLKDQDAKEAAVEQDAKEAVADQEAQDAAE